MNKRLAWVFAVAVLIGGFATQRLISQDAAPRKVGPLPGGGFLLNSGWTIKPAGTQVPVDTLPMNTAISRNGKFLLVLNGGYNPPSVSVIDIAQKKEVGRTNLADCFLGLTISPTEDKVYVGGGTTGKVFELNIDPNTGALRPARELQAVKDLAAKGDALIGDVAVTFDAHILYAADLYGDQIAVINLQTGALIATFKTGKRPYKLLLPPGGRHLLVTAWGEGAIYQHTATTGELVTKVRVGPHPTDMVWVNHAVANDEGGAGQYSARLFVTAANTNNAFAFGASADGQLTALETVNLSLTPMQPLGMTPTALALDPKGTMLYAVCSDGNTVATIDITAARSRVVGFIPTGWYPTAARVAPSGELIIVNGKGLGSKPQTGTVSILPAPNAAQLEEFTHTVRENSPYRDEILDGPPSSQQTAFFERTQSHPSPIEHVIYIIKSNSTYDQVLGDLPKGNGDPSRTLVGEKYTPNLHQLAKDYILYDNFYANADVSAEGLNWAAAAIAPDYTMKLWPSEYGQRSKVDDFEGGEPANTPPAGYIWDNALQAGITVRDYGQWTTNFPLTQVVNGIQIKTVKDPALQPYVDTKYRGWDLDYSDVDRAKEFASEWHQFDAAGKAPGISVVYMGDDHTSGASNADNDYGVGLLVDAVSHSKLWSTTAIFIIEAGAQNGPDHVDSHRAPAWVISPYTKRAIVDSAMYNQAGILRTMELILGLRPMTQFDAAARPMFESFSRTADLTPFNAISPKVSLTNKNPGQ